MSKRPPKLSIVIVTFNSAPVIDTALDSLRALLPDAEIVLVDNGSGDATIDIARNRGVDHLVEGHGNVGFGSGVNIGARVATGKLLLVVNPDVTLVAVDHEALEALARRDTIGLLHCRLVENGSAWAQLSARWSARAELGWSLTGWFLVPRELTLRRPRALRPSSPRLVPGAAFIVSRDEFLPLGGFDERLFLYFEDFDLSRRYDSCGLPIGVTEALTLTHVGHASSPRNENAIISWALLSLIQYAANWEGQPASERLARQTLASLAALKAMGDLLGVFPVIGSRARLKALSAAEVRERLLSSEKLAPRGTYPDAVQAVAKASDAGTPRRASPV